MTAARAKGATVAYQARDRADFRNIKVTVPASATPLAALGGTNVADYKSARAFFGRPDDTAFTITGAPEHVAVLLEQIAERL